MAWEIIAVILLLIITAVFLKKRKQPSVGLYKKQKVLFSPAERSFLGVLTKAVEDKAVVFGKVRVADVLTPISGLSRSTWQTLFNKISGKHFDFILCDKHDLTILCAIELDDKSHNSKSRQVRDAFLKAACDSAKMPLIQIQAKAAYNVCEIRRTIFGQPSDDNA